MISAREFRQRLEPASMGFGLYWQPAIVFFTLANKVHSFGVKSRIPLPYAIWSQTGPKLVADLKRAGIWPII